MDRPLHIKLKRSRIARYYCVVVIFLSWLAIGLADLSFPVQVLLSAVAAVYGWCAIRQLRKLPFYSLEYSNKKWSVQMNDALLASALQVSGLQESSLQAVELQKSIFVGAGIVALSFQLPTGKKMRTVLWPDSADTDSLRRLRAVLLAGA